MPLGAGDSIHLVDSHQLIRALLPRTWKVPSEPCRLYRVQQILINQATVQPSPRCSKVARTAVGFPSEYCLWGGRHEALFEN